MECDWNFAEILGAGIWFGPVYSSGKNIRDALKWMHLIEFISYF